MHTASPRVQDLRFGQDSAAGRNLRRRDGLYRPIAPTVWARTVALMDATIAAPESLPEWLTTDDFCRLMQITPNTAKKWFAAGPHHGQCPRYVVLGRHRRIKREWFLEWVEELDRRSRL